MILTEPATPPDHKGLAALGSGEFGVLKMPWEQISFSYKEWKQIDSEIKTFRKRTRFIVDENIPLDLITVLKEKGYDA